MDSKWRFTLRLTRFLRECFIASSRVKPDYERGWNDAVAFIAANINQVYRGKEPITIEIEGYRRKDAPKQEAV